MKGEIGAIVLNYRQALLTRRCIESLFGQVERVCVVDNSADVDEHLFLRRTLASACNAGIVPHLEILDTGRNLGFAQGVQFGIEWLLKRHDPHALLIINNDAIAHDGMVERMRIALRKNNDQALVAAISGPSSTPSVFYYNRLMGLISHRPRPGFFRYLSGACLLVPVALTQPYLFDPDFFMYGEDAELSWRMRRMGVPLIVAEAHYTHVGSASSGIGSLFYEYHVARGHILLADKLASNQSSRFALLLGRATSLLLRAAIRSVRYRSRIPWQALRLAWLGKVPETRV